MIDTEIAVIGAGPGGYIAAIRAAQLGKSVTLVEKHHIGGICLHHGCIPSKALVTIAEKYNQTKDLQYLGIHCENVRIDFAESQKWKLSVIHQLTEGIQFLLKKYKVKTIYGHASFVNRNTILVESDGHSAHIHFQDCIISTGSVPIEIPSIPFGGNILSSSEALALEEIPMSMVVIGGGYIGIELSQVFARLGTKVTILEGSPSILTGFESRITSYLKRNLKKYCVDVVTNVKATSSYTSENSVTVEYIDGDSGKAITAEKVLVTVGRKPNTEDLHLANAQINVDDKGYIIVDSLHRTSSSNVYAIGDVTQGIALAHRASYEGKLVSDYIAGVKRKKSCSVLPTVVFSDPEIASVGFSEQQAKEKGYPVKVVRYSYGANGRALVLNAAEGFVAIVVNQENQKILGAQIVGIEASNLIGEISLAIELGASIQDIALTIHAHPTLSELLMDAAEQFNE
ncbi:dihydrolipoyl dehydrogenase [Desulfuribacillus stibiiarsenatis]|uniref:Dihydrolipoyl dehydrogenase n=1 Tax=Desulfuribacillus stibiiarsenatis TaxID=1390249 RepID=A0A1E5L726_9FIRM|nr:dihydrolipoyl dehydrogenase [Desulfuribacillus stibiiarsenatis]